MLDSLPSRDDDGNVLCVVEAPRGSRVKLKYEPRLGAMILGRALPLGVHYPFDWGFVPSTRAADGDPIDVLVVHDAPTYPGVVIPCKLTGVVKVAQIERGKKLRNDRLIARSIQSPRSAGPLPRRVRDEIDAFFVTAVELTAKKVRVIGWGGVREAERLLRQSSSRLP